MQSVIAGESLFNDGLGLGWGSYLLLGSVDEYSVEFLLTPALVMGGYALASALHVSGPIAVVVLLARLASVALVAALPFPRLTIIAPLKSPRQSRSRPAPGFWSCKCTNRRACRDSQ